MSKRIKIVTSIVSVVLYFLVSGIFVGEQQLHPILRAFDNSGNSESFFSAASANLFFYTPPSDKTLEVCNKISESSFFFKYKQLLYGSVKLDEKELNHVLSYYIFRAINFPVRLRKKDLLFPFHTFW